MSLEFIKPQINSRRSGTAFRASHRTAWEDEMMHPLTLRAQIMRHMLNLAKDMASSDLFESRKKLEE